MRKSLITTGLVLAAMLAVRVSAMRAAGQIVSLPVSQISTLPILLPSAPLLGGNYQVSFYSDPYHVLTATQCIVFTRGSSPIVGLSNSGNWVSTTFAGWKGQWLQEGLHIQWYGFTSGGLASSADGNLFTNDSRGTNTTNLGGGFFSTFVPPSVTSNGGTFVMTKVPSCPSELEAIESFEPNADPSGKK